MRKFGESSILIVWLEIHGFSDLEKSSHFSPYMYNIDKVQLRHVRQSGSLGIISRGGCTSAGCANAGRRLLASWTIEGCTRVFLRVNSLLILYQFCIKYVLILYYIERLYYSVTDVKIE